MSLESWKSEFYPVDASECGKSHREQIEHSLRKWRGATKENAAKHGCFYEGRRINSEHYEKDNPFHFGVESCSLCFNNSSCRTCPVVLSGFQPCESFESEYEMSAYDPSPMIAVLEYLLEQY